MSDRLFKCQTCKERAQLPYTEFPGDLVCPKCGATDCLAPVVSFQIKTNNGVFHVDDPSYALLSVWVSEIEEQNGLYSAKINHHLDLDENKKLLEGLEWVCDATFQPESGGTIYKMYFAHPGMFHFVPNHKRQDV